MPSRDFRGPRHTAVGRIIPMCFANPDCEVDGRRKANGRLCRECRYVKASCSNCDNTWSQDSAEPFPHKCPDCGRH